MKEIPWLGQLKDNGTTSVPSAVLIPMALEAARQLYHTSDATAAIQLSKVHFIEELPLDNFVTPDTPIEIQLIASRAKDAGIFRFEIYSCSGNSDSDESDWTSHCCGYFKSVSGVPRDSQCSLNDKVKNESLLDPDSAVETIGISTLDEVNISPQGIDGSFSKEPNPNESYAIDPMILIAVLSLPPRLLAGTNLPADYRMHSIDSLTLQACRDSISRGGFAVMVDSKSPYSIDTSIDIAQNYSCIHSTGVVHQAERIQYKTPELKPLFFKPVLLPDPTENLDSTRISLSRLVKLVSHKWPMCDVKVMNTSNESTSSIVKAFQAGIDQRPIFRSMYLDKAYSMPIADGRIYTGTSMPELRYHIIFAGNETDPQRVADRLLPEGIACFQSGSKGLEQSGLGRLFEHSCSLDSIDTAEWQLVRLKRLEPTIRPSLNTVLFGFYQAEEADRLPFQSDMVCLEPAALATFCQKSQQTRFQAIVMDTSPHSIIAGWQGKDLLPWLKMLLKHALSLLWVTTHNHSSPFQKLAGTLLRTLEAEQPSLKVCWLVYKHGGQDAWPGDELYKHISAAQTSMLEGGNEMKLELEDGLPQRILRYYPDDELSCATGTMAPRRFDTPLEDRDYRLSFAAPREPVILSKPSEPIQSHGQDEVDVDIEASVVDPGDLQAYMGCSDSAKWIAPKFFAGTVRQQDRTPHAPQEKVVGWSTENHRNRMLVPGSVLLPIKEGESATEAASQFAALAVATCIIDEVTRARNGDTFGLQLRGPLGIALHQICESVGASFVHNGTTSSKVDFTVTYTLHQGIRVNGQAFDTTKYLASERGRAKVSENWQSRLPLSCSLQTFDLSNYASAFAEDSRVRKEPYSTTTSHNAKSEAIEHVSIYEPRQTLFSPKANYILIGGLGGLGRFICTWMVERGARQVNVISRSGLTSPEAQSTHAEITTSGASLEVFQADACDRIAVRSILSTIRSKGPIKGIINLAMILGDAPMASMTGEEWDRALKVKIDSSWIMHEETMEDELDQFILFSSIASVCGNRNQGNYNVANTFLNALAEYRQEMGRPGISIALGAMTEMGVLHNLSKPNMLDVLTRSGLSHLTKKELAKIMEAAISMSPRRDHPLILTGLEMFERGANNKIVGRNEPLFWAELPEFSNLQTYRALHSDDEETQRSLSLQEQVQGFQDAGDVAGVHRVVSNGFIEFLAKLSGFAKETIDPERSLGMYGVDSLSGVSSQYWFHRELGVDVSVGEILGDNTIEKIVDVACEKIAACVTRELR